MHAIHWKTAGKLGRRCGDHRGHIHRRMILSIISQSLHTHYHPPKVMVGSLDDWQKEPQLRAPNNKEEEQGVKVIRQGIETVIDVKELPIADITLLEPGEILPRDGTLISGHNVKCDESGATGHSDAIKKVSYDDCIAPKEQANYEGNDGHDLDATHAHTNCFTVPGSKVLEGYHKYVVITAGQTPWF